MKTGEGAGYIHIERERAQRKQNRVRTVPNDRKIQHRLKMVTKRKAQAENDGFNGNNM